MLTHILKRRKYALLIEKQGLDAGQAFRVALAHSGGEEAWTAGGRWWRSRCARRYV